MLEVNSSTNQTEVHDEAILSYAKAILESCSSPQEMQEAVLAAEGHIGPINRWFAGTQHIDEIEVLCRELLKKAFHSRYAEHRLVASNGSLYSND